MNANGVSVMQPDFPHPTGNTIPISLSSVGSAAKLASSANASRCGVRIFHYEQTMLHAKVLTIDDQIALIAW